MSKILVTPESAAKALLKRQKELAVSSSVFYLDPKFPKQNAFIEDSSRFIAAQCSRRAGKTNGLALRFFKTLQKYPKSQCLYVSLTQDSAKDILWPILQEINDKYKIGCTFTESRLQMKHPNGAILRLMGADLSNFIKRLKGRKYPGVAIDEAQDFGPHLQSLVDDVLTPSISDYEDGWLGITGTPGPVPHGYFFDITQGEKFGYSTHRWTLIDNPYMPNPSAFIEELKKKRQWDDKHPTLLREWCNHWVLDVESLWIRYNETTNHFTQLPQGHYNYALGIDIGYNDADALAVLAWSDNSPTTYLIEENINRKQGLSELVEQIQKLEKRYKFSKMVIDEGGLGKKLAEEMRRRYGIPVHPADKVRKQENVELLNDALRLGKFKAKSGSQFAQDSYRVQIDWDKSTPNKIVVKKKPHSDIIDAVLYAFKESPAWGYAPEPKQPKYGSKEWADNQQDEMWEAEVKKAEEEAELQKQLHEMYD